MVCRICQQGNYTLCLLTARRDWGSNVTKSLYDEYQTRLDVFRNWFDSTIMSTNHGSDAILVAAYPSHAPSYGVPYGSFSRSADRPLY